VRAERAARLDSALASDVRKGIVERTKGVLSEGGHHESNFMRGAHARVCAGLVGIAWKARVSS